MQSPLAGALGLTPFGAGATPSMLMVGYAALYASAALGIALYLFRKRDL
jgi:sulfite exporter TauE/SafE